MTKLVVLALFITALCTAAVYATGQLSETVKEKKIKAASRKTNASIPDLHDIWIPIELWNRTAGLNKTEGFGSGNHQNSTNVPGKRTTRKGHKSEEKTQSESESNRQDSKVGATPKAEALRSDSFARKVLPLQPEDVSYIENQMALFSVDSWMGNLDELPQTRVKELKALAAASMRNHQKTHPSKGNQSPLPRRPTMKATSSNKAASRSRTRGRSPPRKTEPSVGASDVDEQILSVVNGEDAQDVGEGYAGHSAEGGHSHQEDQGHFGEHGQSHDHNHAEDHDSGVENPAQKHAGESTEFPHEDEFGSYFGDSEVPSCAGFHKLYCDYTEGYPTALIDQVTQYLRWPLEKLFRDLRSLSPPTLADAETGSLICDSATRIIRPGWARNTNGKWLVVINTPYYSQTITEIKCRADSTPCSYIAPCFHSSCQQRYNIQSLLVIDPQNHYKGPFLSHFLFPSSCVCFVPNPNLILQAQCQTVSKYG